MGFLIPSYAVSDNNVKFSLDKQEYVEGDWIKVTGKFPNKIHGQNIIIQISNSQNSEPFLIEQFLPSSDGSFIRIVHADGENWNSEGNYTVTISYDRFIINETFKFNFMPGHETSECPENHVLVLLVTTPNPICLIEQTAKQWENHGLLTIFGGDKKDQKQEKEKELKEAKLQEAGKAEATKRSFYGQNYDTDPDYLKEYKVKKLSSEVWKTDSNTKVSKPDKENNFEQLLMILPPSEKTYRGHISFSSSMNNIQLVSLIGPIDGIENTDILTWSPDKQTKYGLTLKKFESDSGTWSFTGNALAAVSSEKVPFVMTYSLSYHEINPEFVVTESINSTAEMALDHESHNVAFILQPSKDVFRGHLTYSADDKVQVMILHEITKISEIDVLPTWTLNEKEFYSITMIDNEKNYGSVLFSGNGLAIHSFKETPFSASYSLVLNPTVDTFSDHR